MTVDLVAVGNHYEDRVTKSRRYQETLIDPIFAENNIDYNHPVFPAEIALMKAEKASKEKKLVYIYIHINLYIYIYICCLQYLHSQIALQLPKNATAPTAPTTNITANVCILLSFTTCISIYYIL